MRCHQHTPGTITVQNSPALAQTAPKWTTNIKIYTIRVLLGFFSQMEVVSSVSSHIFALNSALLGLWIIAFGDSFTDLSPIQIFFSFCKNCMLLAECRWLGQMAKKLQFDPYSSCKYCTLPSTGDWLWIHSEQLGSNGLSIGYSPWLLCSFKRACHCWCVVQLLFYLSCTPDEEISSSPSKNHTDHAATNDQ